MSERLTALMQRYTASLNDKRAELAELARELEANPGQIQSLCVFSHRLAGSAGSYGFPEIASRARELELLLRAAGSQQARLASLQALASAIETSIAESARSSDP